MGNPVLFWRLDNRSWTMLDYILLLCETLCERDDSLSKTSEFGDGCGNTSCKILYFFQVSYACMSCKKFVDVLSCLSQNVWVLNPSVAGISGYVRQYKVVFGVDAKSVFMHKLFVRSSKTISPCLKMVLFRPSYEEVTTRHVLHIYQQIRICHSDFQKAKVKVARQNWG